MKLKPFGFACLLLGACSSAEPTTAVTEALCVPATCGASTCGAIPDGCGGVVHCGVCTNPKQGCWFPLAPSANIAEATQCHGTNLPCDTSNGQSCAAADALIAADPAVCASFVRGCQ